MNAYVGQPVERIEDLRLLRGKGCYVDDMTLPGLLHGSILRSPVAHGRITRLNADAARALPGVHAVITAAEIGSPVPTIPLRLAPHETLVPYEQPVIADRKVRYVGEPVAFIVADSVAIAEDAAELIELEITSLPPCVDTATAGAGEVLLFEETGTNLTMQYRSVLGDAAAAFADTQGLRSLREQFDTQRHTAATMETRGLLAEWDADADRISVTGAAKVPFASRAMLAKQMGLEKDAVDMVEVDVGGGFGMRGEFYPEDFLTPFAARHVGRPVKWIEDRREHLLACNHAREFDIDVELLYGDDGRIVAVRGHARCNAGAYIRANATIAPRNIGQFFSGPYRIPNIDITVDMLVTNKTPSGTYRGPGRFETSYFCERMFDLAAADVGLDPVEFRRRNLFARDELPTPLATVTPVRKEEALDNGDYGETLDLCLEKFGWAEKSPLAGKLIDGRYHGVGVGCFIEGGAAGPRENARMVLEPGGVVSVYVGSTLVGQGLETICAQIAADALEVPMDQVRIYHGSTPYLHEGWGSYHSRSTVMGGSAIIDAAASLKRAIRAAAGLRLNCAPEDVVLEDGHARSPGGAVSFAQLGEAGIAAPGTFANHAHTYAYGAHAAHVAVDPRTGHVEVIDYVATEDVGRMVNPLALQGQVIGAIVQGLGGVFLEHLVYDEAGQLLTGSLADYLLPVATDYRSIRAFTQGKHPSSINPLGAKGAGEGGVVPVGGVISNAVASALSSMGIQPRSLPLSPSRVWDLIAKSSKQEQAS